LLERYWKFLKKKCLYDHFYDDFDCFRNAIDDCLANSSEKYQDELNTLMTLKFQSLQCPANSPPGKVYNKPGTPTSS